MQADESAAPLVMALGCLGAVHAALAVLSGLIWGVGDFAGGKATQRAAPLPVVWVSKLVSLPLLAIYLVATYVPVTPIGIAWGGMAGWRASSVWCCSIARFRQAP